MSDNKKYYYLKIKENFFESEEIKLLQSMDDGYLFSDILMKLYLKSLKNNGKLMFREHIPYSPKMISTITNHSVTIVEKALTIFRELGLIEVLENGAIYMLDIQNFIGKSSSEGDRKRAYRKKIEAEKLLLKDDKGQMSDKCPPETETEIETELEIEQQEYIKKYLDIGEKEVNIIIDLCNKYHKNKDAVVVVKEKWNIISNGNFNNPIGALIQAIKDDWKQSNNKNDLRFNSFENQRDTDFDELEKKLLGWE